MNNILYELVEYLQTATTFLLASSKGVSVTFVGGIGAQNRVFNLYYIKGFIFTKYSPI